MNQECSYKILHVVLNLLNYHEDHSKCSEVKIRIKKTGVIKIFIDIFLIYLWICNIFTKKHIINKKVIFFKFIAGISILVFESETESESVNPINDNYKLINDEIFDTVVVGSGPGGSLAALKMIENKENVLLIEAGQNFKPNSISHHSFKQTKYQFSNEGMSFCYSNMPMAFAEGATYGGGSEVNSGLYFKLTSPYKEKFLSLSNIDEGEWHNKENTIEDILSVQKSPFLKKDNIKSALINGSKKEGLFFSEVPRWRKYTPVEESQSMQVTYLKNATDLGLKILCETSVNKIIRNDKNISIQIQNKDGIHTINSKKVILAAGTIGTPKILKNSGFLKDKVSFNFHPMTRCVVDYGEPINDGDLFPPYVSWTNDYKHKFAYSVSTYPYIKATLAATGYFNKDINVGNYACYFSSTILEKSRGRLFFIRGKGYPMIYIRKDDRKKIKEGFIILKKILKSGGVKKIWPESNSSPMTSVHIFGSLPLNINRDIGKNGELSIDKRIKICDASLLPMAPWGNPQAVIMVLNEILMERWLKSIE
ncbi:GMC family oxidoreductase N-terminal domain-containing protein [Acidimicrobiaceae bacterium]|nr:GMC family oxidoreductase N-terminal domain-containing protein [Acidimicrobiaceae bacterium]